MTSQPWKQWPAQSPSEDFASRTVDLLLQPDAKVVPIRRSRRRWVAVLAFAAVLAAGTSWAMIRHMVPSQPAAVVSAAPPSTTPIVSPVETPAARFIAPRAEPSAEPPVSSPPPRVVAPASAPPASASAAPPPKPIVVPRCNCEPGTQICACVN